MHMRIYKIAAINLGSTSTKIAYYENENCVFKDNIVHTARALEGFSTICLNSGNRPSKLI